MLLVGTKFCGIRWPTVTFSHDFPCRCFLFSRPYLTSVPIPIPFTVKPAPSCWPCVRHAAWYCADGSHLCPCQLSCISAPPCLSLMVGRVLQSFQCNSGSQVVMVLACICSVFPWLACICVCSVLHVWASSQCLVLPLHWSDLMLTSPACLM